MDKSSDYDAETRRQLAVWREINRNFATCNRWLSIGLAVIYCTLAVAPLPLIAAVLTRVL